jgi:hypothetical protein
LQSKQQRFEFFAAVAAAAQMILYKRQSFGGSFACQHEFGKAIELFKALVAPDLVRTGGGDYLDRLLPR